MKNVTLLFYFIQLVWMYVFNVLCYFIPPQTSQCQFWNVTDKMIGVTGIKRYIHRFVDLVIKTAKSWK